MNTRLERNDNDDVVVIELKFSLRQDILDFFDEVIAVNSKYIELGKDYKNLYDKLANTLTDEQQKTLFEIDEITAWQERTCNEIIAAELIKRACVTS